MTDVVVDEIDDFDDDPVVREDVERPARWPTTQGVGGIRLSPYIPHVPFAKQHAFLMLAVEEAFYGGAAGGGKSDALLMAPLQFIDVPGYAALILRRTYEDLKLPGALIPRAAEWFGPTDARWSALDKTWYVPNGGSLTFGYLEHDKDLMRYASAELQCIVMDESTHMSEHRYRTMFGRLRRPSGVSRRRAALDGLTLDRVPLRMRTGANPGGVGHVFHKRRFVDKETRKPGVIYIPARAEDNPHIDLVSYEAALRKQFPTEWRRMRFGDWEVRDPGELFDKTRIGLVERPFSREDRNIERVRYWDMAGTEVKAGEDPDWAVGLRLALNKETGDWCVEHVVRLRAAPSVVQAKMSETARRDGTDVPIVVEQEPGSEGKHFIDFLRKHTLRGYNVRGDKVTDPKNTRIALLEPIVNGGDVTVVNATWTDDFIDEIDAWPNVEHDDQVDAFAGAHRHITRPKARLRA